MKLNLSFLSQPGILIPTADVRDGNIRWFHLAPKRVQPPIGVTPTIILTMEWESTAMPHLGELSLTLVHRQMETPLGIMRSIPWILAWDTAIRDRNIITTGFHMAYPKIHGLQMILMNASLSGTCLMDFQRTDDAQSME